MRNNTRKHKRRLRRLGLILGLATVMALALPAFASAETNGGQISAGNHYCTVLQTDGTLWVWGEATFSSYEEPTKFMTGVKAISAGGDHMAIIKSDDSLWMVGNNKDGQIGNGSTDLFIYKPVKVMENVASVSAGGAHTAVITKDGSLYTFGANASGQLGNGTLESKNVPGEPIMNDVKSVCAGTAHTIVLKNDGSVLTFGENSNGELGIGVQGSEFGDPHPNPTQVQFPAGTKIVSVSAGTWHTVALAESGDLYGFGQNEHGQLGLEHQSVGGKSDKRESPVYITTGVKLVTAGGYNTALVMNDNSVRMCGDNSYGACGFGATEGSIYTPTTVMDGAAMSDAAPGYLFTLFWKADGTIWASGTNEHGELGNGKTDQEKHLIPEQVGILIQKLANPMTVKGKTAALKYATTQKKGKVTLAKSKVLTVSKAKGTVTYKKKSGNGKITINKSTGKVTVKKGLKKGKTYKVTAVVYDSGNAQYKDKTVTKTFKIKVK